MLSILWTAKQTNVFVGNEIGRTSSLLDKTIQLKLQYFGHIVRGGGLESRIMLGMGEGKRKRGRPKTRWLDGITSSTGISLQELKDAARDRTGWKSLIMRVTRDRYRFDGTR